MGITRTVKLHNVQTNVSLGNIIPVYDAEILKISISGTSTSFTIQFEESIDGINYFPILGDKLSNDSISSTTTTTLNEGWEFDVSAITYFRANLVSITNGNVTVVANSN